MTMSRWFWMFALWSGCTTTPGTEEDMSGLLRYSEPHDDGNAFACSHCHALTEPSSDGFLRPGHPIGDAANRATYKNGQLDALLGAVNSCREEWMAAPAFASTDTAWLELEEFLVSQAGEATADPIAFSVVDPPADLSTGDAMDGQALFNDSCAVCHGTDAVGTGVAPPLDGEFLEPDYIAERIRLSGSTGSAVYEGLTGGRMPFWSAERLTDDQLLDLVAFVDVNDPELSDAGDAATDAPDGSCTSTHAKVGQVAELRERFHDVGGTATIIDDCTIEITNFTFDGQGIDVRFYSGNNGSFDDGVILSEDLRRSSAYNGETVYATLPDGMTLDDLDAISVWCVPVAVSFGDGTFSAP